MSSNTRTIGITGFHNTSVELPGLIVIDRGSLTTALVVIPRNRFFNMIMPLSRLDHCALATVLGPKIASRSIFLKFGTAVQRTT